MRKSSDRYRTDQKFDHKQHKRTHSSCAEIQELELRRSGTYPCGWFSSSAVVGVHIPVTELILIDCEAVNETGKMEHDIYGNWSLIQSWALMKEASLEWTRVGHAASVRADTPAPLGWKRQCGRSCWALCVAVAVETAETMMTRVPQKQLRKACFVYDEAWRTGFSHNAKRQEEKTLMRMLCGACASPVQRFCG